MKEPTLAINLSAAPGDKNVKHRAIWRNKKKTTLEVIHSAALNVTTNAQHKVFESMDEPTQVIF